MMDEFDIAISFDTTGSMYRCIDTVKTRMGDIMTKLMADIPGVRMAVIAHGDYDTDHTYVIKYENFTNDVNKLCTFVKSAEGTGGGNAGNLDEAYELSLHYSRRLLRWRSNANKVLVVIGDWNPHEPHYFLNKDNIDWRDETRRLRDMDVKIYAVQCERNKTADRFYHTIASQSFGQHVSLADIKQIEKVLMDICYRETNLLKTFTGPTIVTGTITSAVVETVQAQELDTRSTSSIQDEILDECNNNGFLCYSCKVEKPIDEFPPTPITDECRHAPLECLRCLVKYVDENKKCPNEACVLSVDPDCRNMKFFKALLDSMFVDYNKVIEKQRLALKPDEDSIMVSTMNGDTEWFPYNCDMTVEQLKQKIQAKFNLKPEQQRLIYNDEPLKRSMRLKDYGIKTNAAVSLIVPLYCIPDDLDHVVFDLSWEFPSTNPDFLDASCMAFENTSFVQLIDWNHPSNKYFLESSVKHTEKNLTGPGAKTGHQTIHVHLKKVPRNITHLYFTLSSWRSPNMSGFHNPSLKFYEASQGNANLCQTTFTHALSSQAVIMCAVIRTGSEWFIEECGGNYGLANGNAKRYNMIRKKIVELIEKRRDI